MKAKSKQYKVCARENKEKHFLNRPFQISLPGAPSHRGWRVKTSLVTVAANNTLVFVTGEECINNGVLERPSNQK
jgi:hypothetical protein